MMGEKDEVKKYLEPDVLCDSGSPTIKAKSEELTRNAKDQAEAAVNIFYFVRDSIKFALTPFGKKASRTLFEKQGFCVSCANLQVALCRAAGIPARYHVAEAKKTVFKNIFPGPLYLVTPPGLKPHAWCEVYLRGKWTAAESVYDKPFYEGLLRAGILTKEQIPDIDWDGEKDCITQSRNFWIRKDIGTTQSMKISPLLIAFSLLIPYFPINMRFERIRRSH